MSKSPSPTAFVYPDLNAWVPKAIEVPSSLTAHSFKTALRHQKVDITHHLIRRDLIYRMVLGGMDEHPYGDDDKDFHFKYRMGQESARARSRLLSVLFQAEKEDLTAPVVDDRTSAAVHLMALTYFGNVDWEMGNRHRDFRNMLQASYDLFDGVRIEKMGREAHYATQLDAAHALLTTEYQKGRIGTPSRAAGRMLLRCSGLADPMQKAGPNGTRRAWDWLDLVMIDEPSLGEDFDRVQHGPGRRSMVFGLGSSKKWHELLPDLPMALPLDSPAEKVLSRFLANDTDMSQAPLIKKAIARLENLRIAQARADRAPSILFASSLRSRHRP